MSEGTLSSGEQTEQDKREHMKSMRVNQRCLSSASHQSADQHVAGEVLLCWFAHIWYKCR